MARLVNARQEDVPIPEDAQAHATWPPIMLEMAAHIGPYATLLIVDALAGQDLYVPLDPSAGRLTEIIGAEKSAIMSHVFGCERIPVPVGYGPLKRARRQSVIAAIREKRLTVSEGAARLRMKRSHLSTLVNKTDEGEDTMPFVLPPPPRDTRQLEMFGDPLSDALGVAVPSGTPAPA